MLIQIIKRIGENNKMKNILIEDTKHKEVKILAIRENKSLENKIDEIISEYFVNHGIKIDNTLFKEESVK